MTRKEAIRRLEYLALETGHRRKHFIKRALVEFLESREAMLLGQRGYSNHAGRPSAPAAATRLNRYPGLS